MLFFALGSISPGEESHQPDVSVVIAARNERTTVGACLAALMEQDYPADKYEVIIADDRSSDGTPDVLRRFQAVWKKLSVVRIEAVPAGISPKKNAVSQAIANARGDIILQTDADCLVPCGWISGMVRCFSDRIAMATGIAPYFASAGWLNSFVRHEYIWNAALSAGSIALGHGTHASARNLAFRKQVFTQLDGYGQSLSIMSGDDTLLLQRIQKYTDSSITTARERSTHVFTRSPETPGAFFRQRIRHMSTGRLFDPFLIGVGLIVYSFHFFLILTLLLSVFSLTYLLVFIGIFVFKMICDAIIAFRAHSILHVEVQWSRFIINEFILLLYMALVPLLGSLVPVKWKEK